MPALTSEACFEGRTCTPTPQPNSVLQGRKCELGKRARSDKDGDTLFLTRNSRMNTEAEEKGPSRVLLPWQTWAGLENQPLVYYSSKGFLGPKVYSITSIKCPKGALASGTGLALSRQALAASISS